MTSGGWRAMKRVSPGANQSSRVSNGCRAARVTAGSTVAASAPPGRKVRRVTAWPAAAKALARSTLCRSVPPLRSQS